VTTGRPIVRRSAEVSVVMPLYDGARYVVDAIRSVASQTLLPREVIVVDDGSTDGGAERLDGLDVPFEMKVIAQANAGQSAARNHGAELATQRFIAFLDQDDVWTPDHLVHLLAPMRRDDRVAWTYGDFDEMDALGRTVTKRYLREHAVPHPKSSLHACVSRDLMVIPSASVLRADAFHEVGGFDPTLSGYEDDDLFIRVFRAGWDHHYVDRTVTRFRIHAGSSSDDARFVRSRLRFAEKLRETIEDDVRFRRYYYRDVIVPRLFQQCLDDYVRHASARDWPAALRARDAMNHFAAERTDIRRKGWKLRLIQDPERLRAALVVQDHLPRRLRISQNPAMRLR